MKYSFNYFSTCYYNMSFLSVERTFITFNNELECLKYINDALQFLINNYDNKKPITFMENEFNSNIELLCLINTIITKLQKLQ